MRNCFILVFIIACLNIAVAQKGSSSGHYTSYIPVLNIKDSIFVDQIDSLILESDSTKSVMAFTRGELFYVYCAADGNGKYTLLISLQKNLQTPYDRKIRGCFELGGYMFIWCGDMPKELLYTSKRKRKVRFVNLGFYLPFEAVEFIFEYSPLKLIEKRWFVAPPSEPSPDSRH